MKTKFIIIGLVLAAVLSMSGCMPGSEKWNIHIAAHCYIKGGGLQEGEKLIFVNGIQRNACVNGKGKCVNMWRLSTLSAKRTAILINASFIC